LHSSTILLVPIKLTITAVLRSVSKSNVAAQWTTIFTLSHNILKSSSDNPKFSSDISPHTGFILFNSSSKPSEVLRTSNT